MIFRTLFSLFGVMTSFTLGLQAELPLTVSPIFQSNMVLQRDLSNPIWGTATSGATITLVLDTETPITTIVDSSGKWKATLPSHPHDGGLSHTLNITSPQANPLSFNNVVFGDVYLASGQSNMARTVNSDNVFNADAEIAAAEYPLIRSVTLEAVPFPTTLSGLVSAPLDNPVISYNWTPCSPTSVVNFSGTGYFFARKIFQETGIPIGIIACAVGGRPIEEFIAPDGIASVPDLSGWRQEIADCLISKPLKYGRYCWRFFSMIGPISTYGIRGTIWYQGGGDIPENDLYRMKMKALIAGWRKAWGQGDFPFYFVQLSAIDVPAYAPTREAQLHSLENPNTCMAVAIDIGDPTNVHSLNKQDIGARLALCALANDYQQPIVFSGPLYSRSEVEGSNIRVRFDYAETGLMIGQKPGVYGIDPLVEVTNGSLDNFEIAGADLIFQPATAVIDSNTVLVSSPSISTPLYVRYCYTGFPAGLNKLYNRAGLPASPFRTDISYELRVDGGEPTTLIPGANTNITLSTLPTGFIMRWTGAASALSDLNATPSIVTMPAHDLYLTSTSWDPDFTYTITVMGGSGGGSAKAGIPILIEASAPASNYIFDRWTGDTAFLNDPLSSNTTLLMPAQNLLLTATYKIIDSVGDGIPDLWRATHFGGTGTTTTSLSMASADPDHDGLNNLMEYALALDPLSAEASGAPSLSTQGDYLTFTYRQNKEATNLIYTVEACNSLSPQVWTTSMNEISRVDHGTYWTVIVQDNVIISSNKTRFMHLKVTKP